MKGKRKNPYARADARTLAAKAQGYPARSVFKLREIDRRLGLLKPGQHVLDLGAAPGSWSLYASQRIKSSGRLLSLDQKEISQNFPTHVTVLKADVSELDPESLGLYAPYQVILSDMAPSTSGIKAADQARSFELFGLALSVARDVAERGSSFVGKLLMGPDFAAAKRAVQSEYQRCLVMRPQSTRSNSSEVFLVGLDKRAD